LLLIVFPSRCLLRLRNRFNESWLSNGPLDANPCALRVTERTGLFLGIAR
jgi:hypothetical protein